MPRGPFTSIGGQAVIEGVMMRSPHFLAVAVRKPNHRIVIRHLPYLSLSNRNPLFKKPVLRGVVTLLESMFQGIESLSFSASIAAEEAPDADGKKSELSSWAIAFSIMTAFALGMLMFVALPHLLTALITS